MKTAISVPEETYRRATACAAALGVSRSELFATAVTRYLDQLDDEGAVREIDAAVALMEGDDSNAAAAAAGRRRLAHDEPDW